MEKTDIKSLTREELQKTICQMGEKSFRANQIYDWMHVKLVRGFDEMTNISRSFREECKERFSFTDLEAVRVQKSKLDKTRKFLFQLEDGNLVESVLMPYKHGNSVCISSQVGCRMGCAFCASTLDGLTRNLKPSEMLDQIYRITKITGERVSNVVVMGTGEPLDNYDNLVRFIRLLTDEYGLHISQRNVTVSTCGLVPGILKLAKEGLQITLALSLHAATDEKRQKLMPVAKTYSIGELMDAVDVYFETTGRRITFEYSLVAGGKQTYWDVKKRLEISGERKRQIYLFSLNYIKERDFRRPDKEYVASFKNQLEKYQRNVTIRREMGKDIDGACGQLRKRHLEECREDIC